MLIRYGGAFEQLQLILWLKRVAEILEIKLTVYVKFENPKSGKPVEIIQRKLESA